MKSRATRQKLSAIKYLSPLETLRTLKTSKVLALDNAQINLVLCSLNRTFASAKEKRTINNKVCVNY